MAIQTFSRYCLGKRRVAISKAFSVWLPESSAQATSCRQRQRKLLGILSSIYQLIANANRSSTGCSSQPLKQSATIIKHLLPYTPSVWIVLPVMNKCSITIVIFQNQTCRRSHYSADLFSNILFVKIVAQPYESLSMFTWNTDLCTQLLNSALQLASQDVRGRRQRNLDYWPTEDTTRTAGDHQIGPQQDIRAIFKSMAFQEIDREWPSKNCVRPLLVPYQPRH